MPHSRRRVLLGVFVSVGLAGCLDGQGAGDSPNENDAAPDSSTPTEDESSGATGTPTATATDDSPSPTDTATSTPEETKTPATEPTRTPDDGGNTPTPPGDDLDDEVFPDYEMTTVGVRSPAGDLLGWVRAAIADTGALQFTGLSDTEDLPEHYGMLFVYSEVDDHTFVMREMDFGIDILFADDDGKITTIHRAPKPGPDEDGSEQHYPGRGQYVLEVNKDWTTERGVEEGDILDIDLTKNETEN